MRIPTLIAMAVLGLSCIAAQAQQISAPLPSITLPVEIDSVLRAYEKAWAAKDVKALGELFTQDGLALPNGSMPARGAADIAAVYTKGSGSPLSLRALAFHQVQDLAYVVGGFSQTAGQPDGGKFVLVLRKGGDGKWRIAADMDNMNARPSRPAAPAAPATPALPAAPVKP
jgi:uncharacterized protein (TIGR02246 family)